jgi:uncharacterized protein YdaU (DUF1376 family)
VNYYERHLGDYARDTAHLSMLEHGAYTLLMDRYYATEQGIPADKAHRLARGRTQEECDAIDAVLHEFFELRDGVWVKNRIEEEIVKAEARREKAKENGKKGGRPLKAKAGKNPAGSAEKPKPFNSETQPKPSGLSLGSENETQPEPNPSENETQKEPSEKLPSLQTPVEETNLVSSTNTGTCAQLCDEGALVPAGAQPEGVPPSVDPATWRLYVRHHASRRRWSAAVSYLNHQQLAALFAAGETRASVTALLLYAIPRNLSDLADAARRKSADAEKEKSDVQRRRPGEGCADAAIRAIRTNGSHLAEHQLSTLIPLEGFQS